MIRTVGLDLSLTATGLAICNDGEVFLTACIQTAPKDGCKEDRFIYILDKIKEETLGYKAHLFAIEDLAYSRVNAQRDIAGLNCLVRVALHRKQVPFILVGTLQNKKFATGSGKASKEEMVAAAQQFMPGLTDHNRADALFLARYGYKRYIEGDVDTDGSRSI